MAHFKWHMSTFPGFIPQIPHASSRSQSTGGDLACSEWEAQTFKASWTTILLALKFSTVATPVVFTFGHRRILLFWRKDWRTNELSSQTLASSWVGGHDAVESSASISAIPSSIESLDMIEVRPPYWLEPCVLLEMRLIEQNCHAETFWIPRLVHEKSLSKAVLAQVAGSGLDIKSRRRRAMAYHLRGWGWRYAYTSL